MILLPWSDLLCVGVREIDEEHRTLVHLINELGNAGEDSEATIRALDVLTNYVQVHFAHEEKLMRDHGFEHLAGHIAQHRGLTGEVARIRALAREGRGPGNDELLLFLRDWLTVHILRDDMEFAITLNGMGAR